MSPLIEQSFTWIVAAMSVAGAILNIRRNRLGFILWSITNASWTIYDFAIGAYAQSALFAVYFGLAIWGICAWKREASR